jgi:hypothetical protein
MKTPPKSMVEYLSEVEGAIANLRLTPQPQDEGSEKLHQQYEMVLVQLERHLLVDILTGNWNELDDVLSVFRNSESP